MLNKTCLDHKNEVWPEAYTTKIDQALARLDRIESILFHSKTILTSDEAALYLGMTTGHFYRVVKKFGIPYTRPAKGKLYFLKSNLDEWLQTSVKSAENKEGE